MSVDYTKQSTSYQGVDSGKIAIKDETGAYGSPIALPYLKSVPLTPSIGSSAVYANNVRVETAVSDNGFTGSIGTTAQERAIEAELGYLLNGSEGELSVNAQSHVKAAVYYEFTQKTESGAPYKVKNWLLNVEIGKASVNHQSNGDSPSIGDYVYPIIVSGDPVLTGEVEYVDDNGMKRTCFRISAFPDTTGYATFGEAVPSPEIAA